MAILTMVNGKPFDLGEALRQSMLRDSKQFLDKCIDELLIRQYAHKTNITNSDDELQVALDELRYAWGLESSEAFKQWLKSNHQRLLSLQNYVDYKLLRSKVIGSIPDSEIKAYFAEHQLDFDRVELYSIRVGSQEQAEVLLGKITEEGKNFHILAMEHSLDEETRPMTGYVGKVTRGELTVEIEAAVFKAQPGEVIGPLKTEKGYNLFKVSAVYPANLESERNYIRTQQFQNLLAQLRAEATITYPILEAE